MATHVHLPPAARAALPARDVRVNRHTVTHCEPGHAPADRRYLAGIFVPDDHGRARRKLTVKDMPVSPANATCHDTHHNFLRSGLRLAHIGYRDIAFTMEYSCFHGDPSQLRRTAATWHRVHRLLPSGQNLGLEE